MLLIILNNEQLMSNFVYGKTLENLRKRMNVKLINNAEIF